jgi:hypothetical protein
VKQVRTRLSKTLEEREQALLLCRWLLFCNISILIFFRGFINRCVISSVLSSCFTSAWLGSMKSFTVEHIYCSRCVVVLSHQKVHTAAGDRTFKCLPQPTRNWTSQWKYTKPDLILLSLGLPLSCERINIWLHFKMPVHISSRKYRLVIFELRYFSCVKMPVCTCAYCRVHLPRSVINLHIRKETWKVIKASCLKLPSKV